MKGDTEFSDETMSIESTKSFLEVCDKYKITNIEEIQ